MTTDPAASGNDMVPEPPLGIGAALRLGRARYGLSQRALAQRVGVSKSRVARWECESYGGEVSDLFATLRTLGFDVAVTDLHLDGLEGIPEPPEHVSDRAGRHLPAHRVVVIRDDFRTYWWTRYGWSDNPRDGGLTYGLRTAREEWERSSADATPRSDVSASATDGAHPN